MDPNAARQKMIEKANLVLAEFTSARSDPPEMYDDVVALCEAVHDLDEWLRKGGFFPEVWTQANQQQANDGRKWSSANVDIGQRERVPTLVDDERPRVDGTVCGYVYGDQGQSCTLDRGHEGLHG